MEVTEANNMMLLQRGEVEPERSRYPQGHECPGCHKKWPCKYENCHNQQEYVCVEDKILAKRW